ncbi:MAG: bifunctional nuclease family protein [Acidimicrobiales bacterium]
MDEVSRDATDAAHAAAADGAGPSQDGLVGDDALAAASGPAGADGTASELTVTESDLSGGERDGDGEGQAPDEPAGAEADGSLELESDEAADEEPLGFELPPAMSQMLFVDVVMVLPSTHPVVVLQEADFPYRELRIPIGGPEGIAIGYASRQLPTPRPLTHELMSQLLESFGLTLDVVSITGLQGGMFTAEITVSGPTGQRVLDCRPSDGIALALRQPIRVPIMADPDVLDRAASAAAGQN